MIYVPLHVSSGHSLLKSALRLEDYIKFASKLGASNLAICDAANFYAVPSFTKLALEKRIKPIIGIDLEISNVVYSLFIKDEVGYRNLLKLHYLYQTHQLTLNNLKENEEGLIKVISTSNKIIYDNFTNLDERKFARFLADLTNLNDCYIGIEAYIEQKDYLDSIRKFLFEHGYLTLAFPHIKYLKKEDAIALKMLEAIDKDEKIDIDKLSGFNYLLNDDEASKLYTKEELENTFKVADATNFNFFIKRGELLHYPNKNNLSSDEYLKLIALKSLNQKNLLDELHKNRLEHELDVIKKMGYSDYFLIVMDYVNYAKKHNIAVGPGRGSAAGSLSAYALNIVDVDPLKYNLYFERFLNPERQSMPDIDLDVSDLKRGELIDYLRKRWGKDKVANIVTSQTILAKQSLRDIGRIYDYPPRDIDLISKLIVDPKLSLKDNYRHNPKFKELIDSDKYYLRIVALASKIEGLPRQTGLHAAGVVLNNEALKNVIPLDIDDSGNLIVQYEMNYLEEQGFLKMDILGLRNLTIIEDTLKNIKLNRNIEFTQSEIPYDDSDAIKLIRDGNTCGIFQLESKGMNQAIKVLKPTTFEDLVALLALYRPGPMDNIPTYAKRKEGKEKFTYLSPALENILKPTYGIIVYQEQIMQIAHVMAGLSLGQADLFRRAISKKDSNKLASLKKLFITGAIKNGYKESEATNVFNLISKFADYGFNRSHSLCYAMISSKMAYLKAHYPEEFFSALLNDSFAVNSNGFLLALSELKKANVKLIGPNINLSSTSYYAFKNNLVFPLNAVKGLNSNLCLKIVKERIESGEYKDFFDFILRSKKYKVSSNDILKLIDAGAFDSLYNSRATLRASIARGIIYSNMMSDNEGLITLDDSLFEKPEYVIKNDDPKENLSKEHDALGIMLSSSPLKLVQDKIKKYDVIEIIDINDNTNLITLALIIHSIKVIRTKKGDEMAFVQCFDDSGEIELTVFSDLYKVKKDLLNKDAIIIVQGKYDIKREALRVYDINGLEN